MSIKTRRGKAARLGGATLLALSMSLALAVPSAAADDAAGTDTPPAASELTKKRHPDSGPPPGANGDNGTVKVHRSSTSADDPRDEPKVCEFYLVGFGFDPQEQVRWRIRSWPPTGARAPVAHGVLTLDARGHGRTADISLPDGDYKLFWKFVGEKGRAKQKVFWVRCPSPSPTPSAPSSVTPSASASASPSASPSASTGPSTGPSSPSPSATTTAPGAQPPSEEPPTNNRGMLPFTGFPAWLAGALALALLLGGATMVVAARRRS